MQRTIRRKFPGSAGYYLIRLECAGVIKTVTGKTVGELQRRLVAWIASENIKRETIGTDFPVYWESVLYGHMTFNGGWAPLNGEPVPAVAPFA